MCFVTCHAVDKTYVPISTNAIPFGLKNDKLVIKGTQYTGVNCALTTRAINVRGRRILMTLSGVCLRGTK